MQTTTTNPTPNQYFRKVKTDGTFKKTFKVLGLYFTVSNCRVKKRISCGYSRQGHDGKLILQAKKRLYEAYDGRCPHCGRKFDFDTMELHHVLPYARFQDLITDERNLLLLCHDCHKEVHCNPFLNIRLMHAKADELGIDLHDRYDYGENSERRNITI
jgi:transcription elongation factor Elf1